MNLKTINVVVFLVGCILIYSGWKNIWPHMLVAKSLGREVKPADTWIDPDAAVKGFARPMDPIDGGGGGGAPPKFLDNPTVPGTIGSIPWNPRGVPFTGGSFL